MDHELIFWIVAAAAAWIAFGVLLHRGKKENDNYVDLD